MCVYESVPVFMLSFYFLTAAAIATLWFLPLNAALCVYLYIEEHLTFWPLSLLLFSLYVVCSFFIIICCNS